MVTEFGVIEAVIQNALDQAVIGLPAVPEGLELASQEIPQAGEVAVILAQVVQDFGHRRTPMVKRRSKE